MPDADDEFGNEAQPDVQCHGANEREQADRGGQGSERGQLVLVKTEGCRYRQKQEGSDDRHVDQALYRRTGDRGGNIPSVGTPHGDDPSGFAQAHGERNQPDPVPSRDAHGREKSATLAGNPVHANGAEQAFDCEQRHAGPNQGP